MNYQELGNILKTARISAGFNQKQVAEYIEKTPQNISSWELGKSRVDIDSFERLCRLYDINFADTLRMLSEKSSPAAEQASDEEIFSLYCELDPTLKKLIKDAIITASKSVYKSDSRNSILAASKTGFYGSIQFSDDNKIEIKRFDENDLNKIK